VDHAQAGGVVWRPATDLNLIKPSFKRFFCRVFYWDSNGAKKFQ
jgi:hypothetical protein